MTDKDRVKIVISWLINNGIAKSQFGVGNLLGYSNKSSFSQVLNSEKPLPKDFIERLCNLNSKLNPKWLLTGEGEMLLSQEPKSEVKPKEFSSHLKVRMVTSKARAGYSESYYSDEYLNDMPTVLIETDREYHGKYLAFEVDGDSMEPDYHPGDIVICREVKRDLWKYKLHYDDWDFVIAHGTQGIMLKQITGHNTETGEIICHSINGFEHPDFTINLKEVAFLYNVVEHRISGKNKRKYR